MRYAFIDVQNTETTTNQLLGFSIDWEKTILYLKKRWACDKVFYYSGFQRDDHVAEKENGRLAGLGYELRAKPYYVYKNRDSLLNMRCVKCGTETQKNVGRGTRWKSNCDVELSVDATNCAKSGDEFLIFSGDGDFEYLVRDLIKKSVKVYVISSAKKIKVEQRYYVSRFSTKFRKLISENPKSILFLELNDWKYKIQREPKTKENAVQAGAF